MVRNKYTCDSFAFHKLELDRTIAFSSLVLLGSFTILKLERTPPFLHDLFLVFRARSIFLSMTCRIQTKSFSCVSKSYKYTY